MSDLILSPNPDDPKLSASVTGFDQTGVPVGTRVVTERALTLYLNRQEIVTMMTIGDHPDLLAVGYLANQNMLEPDNPIIGVDYDDDLGVVVVRTRRETNYEEKLKKKIRTSGCAQGTIFGDVMESFEEDVGRHNAVDKIAGWIRLNGCDPADKLFYTTGRLTSEMVIKCVMMGIPILVSRSGFTAWGVDLARSAGLTLIGRARGARFTVLAGEERVIFDSQPVSETSK